MNNARFKQYEGQYLKQEDSDLIRLKKRIKNEIKLEKQMFPDLVESEMKVMENLKFKQKDGNSGSAESGDDIDDVKLISEVEEMRLKQREARLKQEEQNAQLDNLKELNMTPEERANKKSKEVDQDPLN